MHRGIAAGFVASVLLLACGSSGAQPDPIKAKLDKAKADYETEAAAAEKIVSDALEKAETAARKKGDRPAVDRIKLERELFDTIGVLPKPVPPGFAPKATAAKKTLDAAYVAAVRDFTKAKMDAAAATAEKERLDLKASGLVRPRYFTAVNKNSGLVLAPAKEDADAGIGLCQAKSTGKDHQLWSLVPIGPADTFLLRNKASGLYASNDGSKNPGHVFSLEKETGDGSSWALEREGAHVVFMNVHSKLCIAVASAEKNEGTRVLQWQKIDGADEQRWGLTPAKPK